MKKLILFFFVFSLTSTYSWALTKPLFSFGFNQDYSQNVIGNSQLIVFDNGLMNFETNIGGWGLCTRNEAGQFEGTLKSNLLKKLSEKIHKLQSDCSMVRGCSLSMNQNNGQGIVVIDVFEKDTKHYYLDDLSFKEYFAELASEEFFKALKPKYGLAFEIKKDQFFLKRLAGENLKVTLASYMEEYTLSGESKKSDLHMKSSILVNPLLKINFKKSLKNSERFILSMKLEMKGSEEKFYHLCSFAR